MLTLQDITIDKKDLIQSYIQRKCSQNSEFTFTNLFIWRKSYDIKYVIIDDMLCIMPKHDGGDRSATFPLGFIDANGKERDVKLVIETLLDDLRERDCEPMIRLYDDKTVNKLVHTFPGKFIITEDVNYFDYVYRVDELTTLSGKKFHSKKNHVNRFKNMYSWEYQSLHAENAEECIELFERWYQDKTGDIPGLDEEKEAVFELFSHWNDLDVRGGCLRVDGKMVAFSVGEPLCCKTAVIHLEHADTSYQGAFAAMNQQFLEHEWSDFEFVNREEDMGIPGMRQAKLSYRPVSMVKKYVATLR